MHAHNMSADCSFFSRCPLSAGLSKSLCWEAQRANSLMRLDIVAHLRGHAAAAGAAGGRAGAARGAAVAASARTIRANCVASRGLRARNPFSVAPGRPSEATQPPSGSAGTWRRDKQGTDEVDDHAGRAGAAREKRRMSLVRGLLRPAEAPVHRWPLCSSLRDARTSVGAEDGRATASRGNVYDPYFLRARGPCLGSSAPFCMRISSAARREYRQGAHVGATSWAHTPPTAPAVLRETNDGFGSGSGPSGCRRV